MRSLMAAFMYLIPPTFTVNGKELTDADSEYISDGYFHESEKASAPAFDFIIDGITAVTQ